MCFNSMCGFYEAMVFYIILQLQWLKARLCVSGVFCFDNITAVTNELLEIVNNLSLFYMIALG